jgi:hypothetical protein
VLQPNGDLRLKSENENISGDLATLAIARALPVMARDDLLERLEDAAEGDSGPLWAPLRAALEELRADDDT